MHHRTRQIMIGVATTAAVMSLGVGVANADHSHFIYQPAHGNHGATCRYIAAGQTSKAETDPGGHSFHAHVHTGRPGSDDKGTDFDKESNAAAYVEEGKCVFVNTP